MTARERLQLAYEYAFLPRRLNGAWRRWRVDPGNADSDELKALDEAEMLLMPLPESRPVPSRALYRLAVYQAGAALYGMRTFIRNIRSHLGRPDLSVSEVPPGMVRDIALPGYHVPQI